MSAPREAAGFTLIEVLISLALLSLVMSMVGSLVVQNSKANKAQQMRIEAQSSGRTTLALVTQVLRTAGWDPTGAGIVPVALDSDPSDAIDYIDVFADLNADGDVDDLGETVRIRHTGDRVEWRQRVADPFEVVGVHLSNDADGDGVPEPMFTHDVSPHPTRITVRLTATSSVPEPESGQYFRYTISNVVTLRNQS